MNETNPKRIKLSKQIVEEHEIAMTQILTHCPRKHTKLVRDQLAITIANFTAQRLSLKRLPPSVYKRFFRAKCAELRAAATATIDNSEMAYPIMQAWKIASDEEKEIYKQQYEADMVVYKEQEKKIKEEAANESEEECSECVNLTQIIRNQYAEIEILRGRLGLPLIGDDVEPA